MTEKTVKLPSSGGSYQRTDKGGLKQVVKPPKPTAKTPPKEA